MRVESTVGAGCDNAQPPAIVGCANEIATAAYKMRLNDIAPFTGLVRLARAHLAVLNVVTSDRRFRLYT